MIRAEIEYKDSRLSIRCDEAKLDDWRPVNDKDKHLFTRWIKSYRQSLRTPNNREILFKIGQEIYGWLNGSEGWLKRLFDSVSGTPFILEFTVPPRPGEDELRFLEVPWELPADKHRHLAADPYLMYCPVRRIGKWAEPGKPSQFRLFTVFMAAAPRDSVSLRFEEEESAILDAAGGVGMDLTVEESGTPEFLAECIAREKPVDVLHISCHGTMEGKPALMLENEVGEPYPFTADDLARTLGGNKPRLLFLSACMTSEPDALLNSFSADMLRRGVPAVLGWGGSVRDAEATRFAESLYGYLSRSERLEVALAYSRLELFETKKEKDKKDISAPDSRDWHLARLYLGQGGGGVLSEGQKARRRRGVEYGHKEFLNVKESKIPVAGRREFVGRRRQIQTILREFNKPQQAGVLIHGFGRQGKSSLAARIANRMTRHQVVVVYKNYNAVDILEAVDYFWGTQEIRDLISARKETVRENPSNLFTILKEILEGPCSEHPLLLVIDDFEQALEDPGKGESHRVKSNLIDSVRSVIEAFASSAGKTLSRLMFTCRYRFTLPHRGRDLASDLLPIHLPPMEEYEGRKQAVAKEKAVGVPEESVDWRRMERCIRAARGNPGLQDLLFSLCLKAPKACDTALDAVEAYIESGKEPEGEKLLKFIRNLAVQHLLDLLSKGEKELLRASTLFHVPVPVDTLQMIGQSLGVDCGEPFGDRLLGFGLWEPFEDMVNRETTAIAIHALARPLAGKLSKKESTTLSKMVVKDLFERWGGEESDKRPYVADIELARLALEAKEPTVLATTSKDAVRGFEKRFLYRAAATLAEEAIRILDKAKVTVSAGLLRAACEVSETIGDIKNAQSYIARALEIFSSDKESEDYAYALGTYGRMLVKSGSPDKALSLLEEAKEILKSDRFLRERSIVLREIARIKVQKGEVEEALKLHMEELEVYEEIGDRREKSITLGEIARIQVTRGQVDEALKLFKEVLKICEDLGEQFGKAVTLGDIARIRVSRGEVDEALKLQQEKLKISKEIGDIDGIANTLWDLAQIELQRKSFQKAFEYLSESYAINLKLGRLDGICFVGMYLGRLLCQGDKKEEGIKILERSRDGFKKLGQDKWVAQVQKIIDAFSS